MSSTGEAGATTTGMGGAGGDTDASGAGGTAGEGQLTQVLFRIDVDRSGQGFVFFDQFPKRMAAPRQLAGNILDVVTRG